MQLNRKATKIQSTQNDPPVVVESAPFFGSSANTQDVSRPVSFMKKAGFMLLLILGFFQTNAIAQGSETLSPGAFIINMGVTPQTVGNGLKPYGLIYDLVKNHHVPVKWVINPAKAKDGVDFSHNGIDYRGGPFIIPAEYRSAAVNARISYWQNQGVVGVTTVSTITVPVFQTINFAPRWTLDQKNGSIAQTFLNNAGIPNTAYDWQDPQLLGSCSDLFVMPHADPEWSTHSNLLDWNLTHKGGIWAGCHAVSALENMFNPANPAQQTNFLSSKTNTATGNGPYSEPANSLVLWGDHNDGSVPYSLAFPTDPVMQFMGKTDLAHQNGSEQVFMPVLNGSWRSTTKVGVWDPSQVDVPVKSPGHAAVILYGPGMGDPQRGKVLYEGGHSIAKSTGPDNIAAQRAFFNWSFWAARDKALSVAVSGVSSNIQGGQNLPVSATVSATLPSGPYTYTWTSSCGGTFANASSASTTFTAPVVGNNTPCVIQCLVTDACGRSAFFTEEVTILPGNRAPLAINDAGSLPGGCATAGSNLTLNVLANDTELDGQPMSVTGLSSTTGGAWTYLSNGQVTFTPTANFTGLATATYTVCDNTSPVNLCSTGTISIGVGTPNAQGCYPGTMSALTSTTAVPAGGSAGSVSIGNPANTEQAANYDPVDNTTYGVLNNNADILYLDFGSLNTTADSVRIYFASKTEGSQVTIQVSSSTTAGATGPFTLRGTKTTTSKENGDEIVLARPAGGIRTLRIQRVAPQTEDLWVDAAVLEYWDCVSALPVGGSDETTTLEDVAVRIDVLSNDYSPTGSALKVTAITTPPAHGNVSINPDGTLTYLNTTDVIGNGTDNFSYKVCDNEGYCTTVPVTVNITEDNCPAGQYRALPTTTTTVTINNPNTNTIDTYIKEDSGGNDNYGNDSKLYVGEGAGKLRRSLLRFDLSGIPAGSIISNATLTLTRVGGDGVTLSLSAHRLTNSWVEGQTTWTIRQTGTNWASLGADYAATALSTITSDATNGPRNFNLTNTVQNWLNGTYANHGVLIKQTTTALDKRHEFASSENGTAADRPKLVVQYVTPVACSAIPNRAPLANPDFGTTPSNQPVSVLVKNNDVDPDGNPLTVSGIVGAVTGGSAAVSGNSIIFTPNGSFTGTATFLYRITDGTLADTARVHIQVTNVAPVANNDVAAALLSNSTNNIIAVQSNDTNPDGPGSLTTQIITGPKNGTATVSGANVMYTPAPNFYGKDTIQYRICEPVSTGSCEGPLCSTAFVYLTVNNRAPVANTDFLTTNQCSPVQVFALSNDSDPEGQPIVLSNANVSNPAHGTVVIDAGGQSLTFIPSSTASGVVTINYTVCDNATPSPGCSAGTVQVTVSTSPSINAPPVANNDVAEPITRAQVAYIPVLSNDSDPEGKALTLSLPAPNLTPANSGAVALFGTNQLKFTPAAGFLGTATFSYRVCDQAPAVGAGCQPLPQACSTASVSVTVINQSPSPADDLISVPKNTQVNVFPDVNDNEPDGDPLILQSGGSTAQGGSVTLNNNGTPSDNTDDYYVYTPQTGYSGTDQFVYQVCDNLTPAGCATGTMYFSIAPAIDLQLTGTYTPGTPVVIGSTLTFTLTLTNNSITAASGVTVQDLLPASFGYLGADGDGTYDPVYGIWSLGNLGANTTATLDIHVEVLNMNDLTNIAQVYTANEPDSDSSPNNMANNEPAEDDEFAMAVTPLCSSNSEDFGVQVIGTGIGLEGFTDDWSASWGDYDNDGYPDLFTTTRDASQPNSLYHNNGDGTFTKITSGSIATDLASSLAATWGDYDNDGDLDLFVANNIGFPNFLYRNEGGGTFIRIENDPIVSDLGYAHGASWADYDNDGYLDLFVGSYFETFFNLLYHNNGDGTFTKVSNNPVVTEASPSITGVWGDYNNDGLIDLFVVNTGGVNNSLYKNTGNGTFQRITTGAIVNDGGSSVGASWGDYDNDGDLDLFVANAGNENNFLYRNNGNGSFTKVTSGAIVSDGGHSHGSGWGDFDKDGDLDLFVSNDGQNNFLYRNEGNGNFTKVTESPVMNDGGKSFGSAWADYDQDGDVDLFVANRDNGQNFLYKNEYGICNSWLNVKLTGTRSNSSAIGAKVYVWATIDDETVLQMREVSAQTGGGTGGQSDLKLTFGLGDASTIDSVVVLWPSGYRQVLAGPAVNQSLFITEDNASKVCGTAYYDINGNCVKDLGETGLPNIKIVLQPGNIATYTDANGYYEVFVKPGNYGIQEFPNNNWEVRCPNTSGTAAVSVVGYGNEYCGFDFGNAAKCAGPELKVEVAVTAHRVGFENLMVLNYENNGASTATNVLLKLTPDPTMTIVESTLPWDNINQNRYEWNLPSLEPNAKGAIYIKYEIAAATPIGQSIQINSNVTSAEVDCNTSNNNFQEVSMATGAIDPNDILVSPEGAVDKEQYLSYKIRFQNVGNSPAANVRVEDQLPAGLDLTTLEMGAVSHAYQFQANGRTLSWTFPNINLPDSVHNEPQSHGYINFRIKPRQDLLPGDRIINSAIIYFDNLEGIITNEVVNFIRSHKNAGSVFGLLDVFPVPSNGEVVVYAVPQNGTAVSPEFMTMKVFDLQGQEVWSVVDPTGNRVSIDLKHLPTGTYFIKATGRNGQLFTGKIILVK